jgi:sugar lactone lactonase YvrE
MARPSSFAFGADDTFGTCHESRNTYGDVAPPNYFMGPSLWPADLDVYARVNQDPRTSDLGGSHIDMLHQSPLCMGIAHERGNAFWIVDGYHGDVVRYDFVYDHGPGHHDHSDGRVRRYPAASITRFPGVASHAELDHDTGWLYVADTGGRRVIRLDTRSGTAGDRLRALGEDLAEYREYEGATVEVFADRGLNAPSGIALHGGKVFVSDNATGQIVAYDLDGTELGRIDTGEKGIMGLAFGPEDGKLYFVNAWENTLTRIDP